MMSSIFSTFDMTTLNSSNPLIPTTMALGGPLIFTQMFWVTMTSRSMPMKILMSVSILLSKSAKTKLLCGSISMMTSIFYILVTMNISGALPLMPALTPHLAFTISLALPLWLVMVIMNMLSMLKTLKAHMLPENTPITLTSFLSSVESLSSIIRPVTLSFRLAANISAGHIILGMMSTALSFTLITLSMLLLIMMLLMGSGYASFELTICVIQAFVFVLLTNMYSSDHLYFKSGV